MRVKGVATINSQNVPRFDIGPSDFQVSGLQSDIGWPSMSVTCAHLW